MVHRQLSQICLWILQRRLRFRVTGESMQPTLFHGDHVLVNPYQYRGTQTPQVGDIILAQHPIQSATRIIKRIAKQTGDDSFHILGDNPDASTDSRSFGQIQRKHILGKIVGTL